MSLPELWQQILAGLELPSTRMLLSQQAQLVRLDDRRAVVTVAGNWMAMVQSRLPLLEKAVAAALGSARQVVLEAGGGPAAPPVPVPLGGPDIPRAISALSIERNGALWVPLAELGETIAGMTPCMRLYAFLGQSLAKKPVAPAYEDWVKTYSDPGFEALAVRLEGLLDQHATNTPAVCANYRRAMELEYNFFDANV